MLTPPEPKNIVETAIAAGNFQTLLAGVEAAELVETLQGRGLFSVFAPSDKAFAKPGEETLVSLLETKNRRKLRSVLEYHLIPRRLSFDDVEDLTAIKTAQGGEVRVKVDVFADPGLAINQSDIGSRADYVETKKDILMLLGLKDDSSLADLSSLKHPLGVIKISRHETGLKFRLEEVIDGNDSGEPLLAGEVRWAASVVDE